MGIPVKGPDVNESDIKFTVNDKGEVRFALSAIKGVGDAAVESIVAEREKNGPFKSVYDLTKRVNLRSVNKKSLESLALAGGFDCFAGYHRAQYFLPDKKDGMNLLEKAVRYGSSLQNAAGAQQNSLFGEVAGGGMDVHEPTAFGAEEWTLLEKLQKEKEVIGIYISGHPLEDYRLEIQTFTTCKLNELEKRKDKESKIAGIIASTETKFSKNGNKYCRFTIEDFDGSFSFFLNGKDYIAFKDFVETPSAMVYITGRYQPRYNSETEFEFKITRIELLSDIRNKLTKFLTLELPVPAVNEKLIGELDSLLSKYPGQTKLRIKFVDAEEGIAAGVSSSTKTIELSNHLFQELAAMHVVFSLN